MANPVSEEGEIKHDHEASRDAVSMGKLTKLTIFRPGEKQLCQVQTRHRLSHHKLLLLLFFLQSVVDGDLVAVVTDKKM